MNPQGRAKDEFVGASSSSSYAAAAPQPMEGLHDAGPPPFLTKTYDIVEDCNTNHIISWSIGNNSFVVWDPQTFSMSLLPKYFKHNNFSSFVRQLNTYGFGKVDPDRWEFANEGFLRGQRHLLKNIRRRNKSTTTQQSTASHQALEPYVEVGRFGLDCEVDRLRRDKQVLMVELVKLRQQQQSTTEYLQVMEQRLRRTEMKQQQMVGFLARAMQNPNFVLQLRVLQQKHRRKEFEEYLVTRKRRRLIDHIAEFELSEIEKLAMDRMEAGLISEHGSKEKCTSDDGFWEDLILNEDIEDEDHQVENVDVLVEKLGILSSSPK